MSVKKICSFIIASILSGYISSIQSVPITSNRSRNIRFSYDESDVCNTEECIRSALFIKSNMDTNINPCDDFYQFACGNFMSDSNAMGANSFTEVSQLTLNQLRDILNSGITDDDIRPLQMAKEFYESCLHDNSIKTRGIHQIYEKIKTIGHWPLNDVLYRENNFSWIETIKKSRKLGFSSNYLTSVFILNNPKNSSIKTLSIGPPTLAIPAFSLRKGLDDPLVQKYLELMYMVRAEFQAYSREFLPLIQITRQLMEIKEILKFEIELAKISPSLSEKHDDLLTMYKPQSIEKIQNQYLTINWLQYIEAMVGHDVAIHKSEKIGILFPGFVNELDQLISRTPKRVIDNYLLWRYILFSLKITSVIEQQPRWKACMSYTLAGFDRVIDSKYIQNYFLENNKENILEIIKRIKREIHKSLSISEWIDEVTRKHALDKLEAIIERVGYSEDLLKTDEAVDFYKNLHINPQNYYDSVLNISKFILDVNSFDLRRSVNRSDWPSFISPMMVNAFYIPSQNSIIIPAALLQNNFYSIDRPNYLNYGAVGFIIGHELSHAFDDYGSHFDKHGNFEDWWETKTKEKYAEKVKCFVDQYNAYKIDEIGEYTDGKVTLGENIADNEGISKAYYAYKSWVKEHGTEKRLPGLDYNPEQLFWISAANIWCSKYSPSYVHYLLNVDNHALPMIRINGQVVNQKEFAEDFSCPSKSKMNPTEKCTVWS